MHTSYEQRLEFLQQFSDGLELFSEKHPHTKIAQGVEASRIWSYGSGEYGGTYIWSGESGQGLENLGAYVTEIAYKGDAIIEVELTEPEYTCPQCEMGYVGELAIKQRKNFEDACEDCGVILSCPTCGTDVERDESCPNGCDATMWS